MERLRAVGTDLTGVWGLILRAMPRAGWGLLVYLRKKSAVAGSGCSVGNNERRLQPEGPLGGRRNP